MAPTSKTRGALAAALVLLAVLAGTYLVWPKNHAPPANPTATAETVPNVPHNQVGVQFRWTAADGIDLISGVAVPVRAYYESRELMELSGDPVASYPGFTRAVRWPARKQIFNAFDAHNPNPFFIDPPYPERPMIGNIHYRMMSVTRSSDTYQVVICVMNHYLYQQTASGSYQLLHSQDDPLDPAYGVERIDLTDHHEKQSSDTPSNPTAPQRGPQQAPLIDVFGSWQIGNRYTAGLTSEEPQGPTDLAADKAIAQRCQADMPLPPDQRPGAHPLNRSTEPPTLPAEPGWPARSE